MTAFNSFGVNWLYAFRTYICLLVIVLITSLKLSAYTCPSYYTELEFLSGASITDESFFLITVLSSPDRLIVDVAGSPGSVRIELSGAVTSTTTDNFAPFQSNVFTPVTGAYTAKIMLYENSGASGLVCDSLTINFTVSDPHAFSFTESAASWGINLARAKDGGNAFGDFDNDGDLDLLVNTSNNSFDTRLYRNNGNSTFTDVTSSLAPHLTNENLERSVVWADFNNDGFLDFSRNTSYTGRPRDNGDNGLEIYIQDTTSHVFGDGIGGTTPIYVGNTTASDVDIGEHNTEGLGVFDFEGDGDIDIVFDNHDYGTDILRNNYINHTTGAVVAPPAATLFSFATAGAGVVLGLDQSATDGDYGSTADVDNDGWVDIIMRKNDNNDFFFNGGGVFTSSIEIGDATNSNKGAVAIYDYDNDGDLDIFWSEQDDNEIHRNNGDGTWTGLGAATGIPVNLSTDIDEVAAGDLDNDGDIDLLLVGDNRSFLYVNQLNDPSLGANVGTALTFVLESTLSFNTGRNGEGTTMVDIDMDGDLDIYMNIHNQRNQLWINNLYNSSTVEDVKNYLFVEVLDDRDEYMQMNTERMAYGATVQLEDCAGNVISGLREVNGGTGHGSQAPSLVHFGLKTDYTDDYQVRVKYPNFINNAGDTIRTEIVKHINPLEETTFPVTLTFRTSDVDDECLCAIDDNVDGDFRGNLCDLDDDNDSILDTLESFQLRDTLIDCSGDIDYDFSGPPVLISGSSLAEGAIYRYDDVASGVDAYVTVQDLHNATIATIDDNSADASWFKPRTAFSGLNTGERAYVEYLIEFTIANTTNPDVQDALNLSFNDIDGNTLYAEESAVELPMSYSFDNPTELTFSYVDGFVIGTSGSTEYIGVTNSHPQVNYYVKDVNTSSVTVRFGAQSRSTGASAGGRQHALQFTCPTYFINAQTMSRDTDGDGIININDLDSDNDGIYDAVEAGHDTTHTLGVVDGVVDIYGIPWAVSDGSGGVNFTIQDSDSDMIIDAAELDSDDDGCFDTHEAYVKDQDRDGIADTSPVAVDSYGRVTVITYRTHPNYFWRNPVKVACTRTITSNFFIPAKLKIRG